MGDITGDGKDDFVVSNQGDDPRRVHLFSGVDGACVLVLLADPSESDFGFTGEFGSSIAGAGDVDGDGIPEIVIGDPFPNLIHPITRNGYVHVCSGAWMRAHLGQCVERYVSDPGCRVGGLIVGQGYWALGTAVSSAGDVNGDGRSDILVNAAEADTDGDDPRSGNETFIYTLSALGWGYYDPPMRGGEPCSSGTSARCVAGLGDIDFDSRSDVVFAESGSNCWTQPYTYIYTDAGSTVHAVLDTAYVAVSRAGDIDSDGVADVVVADGNNYAYVYSLAQPHLLYTLGDGSFPVGLSISGGLDVNCDGRPDIVGASSARVGVFSGGIGHRMYSLTPPMPYFPGGLGSSVDMGDFNGDGLGDIVIGWPGWGVPGQNAVGAVLVFLGRPTIPCDMNCDGVANVLDINVFVLPVSDLEQYRLSYPCCDFMAGDANGDGNLNILDSNDFVTCILNPPGNPCP